MRGWSAWTGSKQHRSVAPSPGLTPLIADLVGRPTGIGLPGARRTNGALATSTCPTTSLLSTSVESVRATSPARGGVCRVSATIGQGGHRRAGAVVAATSCHGPSNPYSRSAASVQTPTADPRLRCRPATSLVISAGTPRCLESSYRRVASRVAHGTLVRRITG